MSERGARRFWSDVSVERLPEGFAVRLDSRPLRTPARRELILPTGSLAEAVAEEWDAQKDKVDPASMPATRSANAAIDRVAPQREVVADMLTDYAATDLLCYRAATPEPLAARQREHWDPLLAWAEETSGARLVPVAGLMPREQSPEALAALGAQVREMDSFRLTAFHDLVTLSGSLVLALAVIRGRVGGEEAWAISRVDEEWQAEQWGRDPEADAAAAVRRVAFLHAARFYALSAEGR